MTKLRIAGAALNQTPLDWSGNLHHIYQAIHMAREQEANMLCLPELCITAYSSEDLFLSDWFPKKALEQLENIIPHSEDMFLAVGLPIRVEGKLYNTVCVMVEGEIKGFVAKQFLADEGVHYEPRWFSPWPRGKTIDFEFGGKTYPFGDIIFDYKGIKVGFEICEDAWRGPNRPAYNLKERGVDLIFNPSASHFALNKSHYRHDLAQSASEELGLTYLYVNMLGNEGGRMIFDGDMLLYRNGSLIQRNRRFSMAPVNLICETLDFETKELLPRVLLQQDPADPMNEFSLAVSLGLFDYLRKSHTQGFVLSLSGGADSSACAVLVAEMVARGIDELGLESFIRRLRVKSLMEADLNEEDPDIYRTVTGHLLHTAYQGTQNSSQDTFDSAKTLAESLGAQFSHWNIDEEVASYTQKIEGVLGRSLTWEQDDIALQNIQARARSPIIWMLTNVKGFLLLSTSNRSEGDVGYATMDGDTSGSLSPIAAIDKHFLLQWLRYAEDILGYDGLRPVNRLQPSAELRPQEQTQTDEDDLMPYPVLVEIERLAIRDRLSPKEVLKGLIQRQIEPENLLRQHIKKFFRLWSINQWKRERLAPSFHLDDFNVDPKTWCRFPILSGAYREELEEL